MRYFGICLNRPFTFGYQLYRCPLPLMKPKTLKIYNRTLQASVVLLSCALFWFAFIFYPTIVGDLKSQSLFSKNHAIINVSASNTSFPIETPAYKITYEPKSGTYYVFVKGTNLTEYIFNKDNAKLALKTALSMDKVCSLSVIYVSDSGLKVPQKYTGNTGC